MEKTGKCKAKGSSRTRARNGRNEMQATIESKRPVIIPTAIKHDTSFKPIVTWLAKEIEEEAELTTIREEMAKAAKNQVRK